MNCKICIFAKDRVEATLNVIKSVKDICNYDIDIIVDGDYIDYPVANQYVLKDAGIAKARNFALSINTDYDTVCMIDNDILVYPGCIETMLRLYNDDMGVIQANIHKLVYNWNNLRFDDLLYQSPVYHWCSIIGVKQWQKTGWDNNLCYRGDDNQICCLLRRAGYMNAIALNAHALNMNLKHVPRVDSMVKRNELSWYFWGIIHG